MKPAFAMCYKLMCPWIKGHVGRARTSFVNRHYEQNISQAQAVQKHRHTKRLWTMVN